MAFEPRGGGDVPSNLALVRADEEVPMEVVGVLSLVESESFITLFISEMANLLRWKLFP